MRNRVEDTGARHSQHNHHQSSTVWLTGITNYLRRRLPFNTAPETTDNADYLKVKPGVLQTDNADYLIPENHQARGPKN